MQPVKPLNATPIPSRVDGHILKKHFKVENGVKAKTFESHLCEVIYRFWMKGNIVERWFSDMKQTFNLISKPVYTIDHAIFDYFDAQDLSDLNSSKIFGLDEARPSKSPSGESSTSKGPTKSSKGRLVKRKRNPDFECKFIDY